MRAELVNCNKCGILFKKTLRNTCSKCLEIENSNIGKINNYIKQNLNDMVSIQVLSHRTGVAVSEIQELLKNGRLTNIKHRITVNCKVCGGEITNINSKGNFCYKCSQELSSDKVETVTPVNLKNVQVNLKKFDKDVMHTKKESDSEQKYKYGFKRNP